jgi:hypothetical protein
MSGLVGSTAGWWPSAKSVMNQSLLRMPLMVSVREGPPWVLLSCVPP